MIYVSQTTSNGLLRNVLQRRRCRTTIRLMNNVAHIVAVNSVFVYAVIRILICLQELLLYILYRQHS
jgi:hypothetical protein